MLNTREPEPAPVGRETSAVEARQGVISGRVLLVLITSLLLAAIALTVSYCALH